MFWRLRSFRRAAAIASLSCSSQFWRDCRMSTRWQIPLDAKVLPDSPPPRTAGGNVWNWILASSAFVGFVTLFGAPDCGGWDIGSAAADSSRPAAVDRSSSTGRRRASGSPRSRKRSKRRESGCSPAELRELDRLFARIAASAQSPQLDSLIDLDAAHRSDPSPSSTRSAGSPTSHSLAPTIGI